MELIDLVNPKNTVVLVVDIQNDYCSERGALGKIGLNMHPVQAIIPQIETFLNIARKYKLPVIWIRAIEDPRYLKKNMAFKIQSAPDPINIATPGTWGFEYYKIHPLRGEPQVIKKGYDAFSSSKLRMLLRLRRIKNVIILGVYTAVCVDTTVRSAHRIGYHVVVPKDLVSMPKERLNLHEAALINMDIIFAHLMTSKEISAIWKNKY